MSNCVLTPDDNVHYTTKINKKNNFKRPGLKIKYSGINILPSKVLILNDLGVNGCSFPTKPSLIFSKLKKGQ